MEGREITEKVYNNIKAGDVIFSKNTKTAYTVLRFYSDGYGDYRYGLALKIDDSNKEYLVVKSIIMDNYLICSTEDNVNHPKHYISHPSGVECITITRHYCFSIGNAIKYLWRAGLKKDASLEDKQKEIEDLEKAIWYINDRIKQLKES